MKTRSHYGIVFWRLANEIDSFKKNYWGGAPDLIVEIVSPDSCIRDRVIKYGGYGAAGVKEYWLPDPDHRQAGFFRLGADSRFHLETPDESGVFRSAAFAGFWLKTGRL